MDRTLVIKVGTHVVTQAGRVRRRALEALCGDIDALMSGGDRVVLVSSGAVAAGRDGLASPEKVNEIERRQVCSAVGQVRLMQIYRQLFAARGRQCAQVLATRSDFRDRVHYLNMQRCLAALLDQQVVPVVNENDVVSVTELMFTDNDELAGLLAAMLGADSLFLLSNVPGILSDQGEVIPTWDETADSRMAGLPGRSEFGRGGIHTKLKVAQRTADLGIEATIADGRQHGIVLDLLAGKGRGTHFPARRSTRAAKRWVASSRGNEKGQIIVNDGAGRALRDPARLTSLLPVGVVALSGTFQKGDIIRIQSEAGELIGWGRAQYGSESAAQWLGRRGGRALIHYDYLYIEQP